MRQLPQNGDTPFSLLSLHLNNNNTTGRTHPSTLPYQTRNDKYECNHTATRKHKKTALCHTTVCLHVVALILLISTSCMASSVTTSDEKDSTYTRVITDTTTGRSTTTTAADIITTITTTTSDLPISKIPLNLADQNRQQESSQQKNKNNNTNPNKPRTVGVIGTSSDDFDDTKSDETCRRYLLNFLNGTTDAKDECQGFSNAIQAADCQNKGNAKNHTMTNVVWWYLLDRLGISSDAYELWECCRSITEFYETHCSQSESSFDAFTMFGIVMVLVICGFMKSMIRITQWHWIPDAGACIIVGAVVGGTLRVFSPSVVSHSLTFDNDLFLQIMLPPIVFQAALMIDKRAFRRDIFPILTLAIFGTVFSAMVNGYLTYYLSLWMSGPHGQSLPLLDSLLFGALMSSIDPIATLSILSSVGILQTDTMYILIFGESLLNDGVSIVLFNSLVQHLGTADDIDRATVHHTMQDFLIVTIGSIVIGITCGVACTLYFWSLSGKHNAVTEVAMFFMWALVPYYFADGCGLSGIISTMVMGFLLDFFVIGGFQSEEREWLDYMNERIRPIDQPSRRKSIWEQLEAIYLDAFSGRGHLDQHSRHHVGFVAEVIANLMETAIFAYLGLFLFNDKSFNVGMIFSGLFSSVSSRAVMVVLFSLLINACVWIDLEAILGRIWYMIRRSNSISIRFDEDYYANREKVYLNQKTQLIMFAAGVRGAVSYALVQNIPIYDAVTKHGSMFKNELRAMTAFTVVTLLFTFGALTYFTLKRDQRERQAQEHTRNQLTTRLISTTLTSDVEFSGDVAAGLTSLELNEHTQPSEAPIQ